MSKYNTPIMLAPNGARRTMTDHPAIPVTIDQTLKSAKDAKQAGAHALHAHVRNSDQKHVLDANAYSELLSKAPEVLGDDFPVQITTEAFGIYSADEQIALVKTLKPRFASIAMREIIRTTDLTQGRDFYQWCLKNEIGVQHILYDADELTQFHDCMERDVIPAQQNAVLMVVGRYTESVVADPDECTRVVDTLANTEFPWMLCAFGQTETACLSIAAAAGGGVRIGFENSLQNADGSIASSNTERVHEVVNAIGNTNEQRIDTDSLYRMLGGLA